MDEFFGLSKSIAVLGGAFDPIHYGHLRAGEYVKDEFNVEKVIFIPSGTPPHKSPESLTPKEHRFEMCKRAVMGNSGFGISSIEVDEEGYTYTVDTLEKIRTSIELDIPIYFIVGADSLVEMEKWKNPGKIFSLATIVVVGRPGTDNIMVLEAIKAMNKKYSTKILFPDKELINISSSDIRQKLKQGKSAKYLIPQSVEDYIMENQLYLNRHKDVSFDYDSIERYIKLNLSQKRYVHSHNVADIARRLAKAYGLDMDKAYVAGLLHDIAKEIPNEKKLELCDKYSIEIDDIMKANPSLTHSFLSAAIAEDIFAINDKDLLNAISYHTTGRGNMSVLEKILFIADIIEPSRPPIKMLETARELAQSQLNKSLRLAIEVKLDYTKANGNIIHPLSIQALDSLNEES